MQYLEKMEKLRVKQADVHRIEWEYKKRVEESDECKLALNACQSTLVNERSTLDEMSHGGEDLKSK